MLKYWLEYNDVMNVSHRLEIYDDAFSGTETEINGNVFLEAASVINPLEAIRGSALRVQLHANTSLTFDDLYSENQKSIPIIYQRDSVEKFKGWLTPDGWYEDFVKNEWLVSFDCVDGLGYLENLSFVDNDTGLQIIGYKTMLEVISLALIRTGVQQNINVDIQVFYTGLADTVSILENATLISDRYIKEDGDTIMSCENVLRDILEPFGACITSRDGEWFIYKPNQLVTSPILSYFRYDYLGVALSPTTSTKDISFNLRSNVNGFYPHHSGENQRIAIKGSIGAYRINYKYGNAKSLIANTKLCTDDSITISEWVILSNTNMTFPVENDCGVSLNVVANGTGVANIETNTIPLTALDILDIKLKLYSSRYPFDLETYFRYQVTLDDGVDIYYLHTQMNWVLNTPTFLTPRTTGVIDFTLTLKTSTLPVTGDVKLIFYTPEAFVAPIGGIVQIKEVIINIADESETAKVGEFHTVQRTSNPSANVESVKEVYTGDNETESYIGALYKVDALTTTMTWFRKGITEEIPILGIMGQEILRMSQNPARKFTGDVFGFYDYLSVVTIDGLDGVFMPISYNYDTLNNTITAELLQIFNDELADIDYSITYDYGNVVTPTIKG